MSKALSPTQPNPAQNQQHTKSSQFKLLQSPGKHFQQACCSITAGLLSKPKQLKLVNQAANVKLISMKTSDKT